MAEYTALNRVAGTPLEEMKFVDILQYLPEETQKELLGKRVYFAEKTGVTGILEED